MNQSEVAQRRKVYFHLLEKLKQEVRIRAFHAPARKLRRFRESNAP